MVHHRSERDDMNIRPIGERIAVRKIEPPTTSSSGIFVGAERRDDGFVKHTERGQVIAVGSSADMWGLQVGDLVEFSPVGSATFEVDGRSVTMIRRDAVVGVHA
jgi:co-chaperonin GroES (HSP10)